MTPSISVCILSYNYGRYLGQAIDSVLSQTPGRYHLTEVIVLDDGSTDNSLDVCADYGNRITPVLLPHRGFGATLTAAVEHAHGDWIALLDADDWFDSAKLTTVADAITDTSLLVQHWERVVNAAGRPLLDRPHPGGNTSTLVVKRSAAADLIPVTNEAFFHVLDDVGRGVNLTEPLINYRVHDTNMTDRATPGVFQDYLRRVNEEIALRLHALAGGPPAWADRASLRRLAKYYVARAQGHAREAAVQRGRRQDAFSAALAALCHAIYARRGIRHALVGVGSALTLRPTVRLGRAQSESPRPDGVI